MHKNQNQSKSNSTISSGKTKIVYTQYYFWQSQNIVLLRRARVSPSFCVRKNSPDRSLKMSDCLKKKVLGRLSFFDLSDEPTSDCLRFALQTKKREGSAPSFLSQNIIYQFIITCCLKNFCSFTFFKKFKKYCANTYEISVSFQFLDLVCSMI